MTANLTEKDGEVQFAYARQYGDPWHKLGKPMPRLMTIDEALNMVGADDVVEPGTVYMRDPNANSYNLDAYVEMPGQMGLYSSIYGPMPKAHGVNYEIMQRREILELAYEIVGLSNEGVGSGPAAIDTIGNLGQYAEKFFSYLRLPTITIDPNGCKDEIKTGLVVATSFDGTLKNTICKSDVRGVCENTLRVGIKAGTDIIAIRHTLNAEQKIRQAARALEYMGVVNAQRQSEIESWLGLDGDHILNAILDHLWDISDEDLPGITRSRRLNARGSVRYFYEGEGNTCVDLVGRNAWAAYNALTEYLDHHRPVRDRKADGVSDDVKRAESAVLPGDIYKTKLTVSQMITEMKEKV